ncbi:MULTISPECIES: hypothetical protein [Vibrio]|uniref:Uncharacterized protein n=1 Tax=Vibrio rotiferianus TaxID=190895 RepID=A0A510IEU4_9VIBR|nr:MULTISPECIES: hypothetical protein [Vibrio]BBL92239.1 hypothetical protein VroAM7_48920 [Vibrio rotiferianus]
MSKYPPGRFVGYRKFVVDQEWLAMKREQRELERQRQFQQWSQEWITVYRLKKERLWTSGAIKRFLGEPIQQGKYKVFKVEQVRKSERKKAFIQWLAPRLEKKQLDNPYFTIKTLGQI